MTVNQRR